MWKHRTPALSRASDKLASDAGRGVGRMVDALRGTRIESTRSRGARDHCLTFRWPVFV